MGGHEQMILDFYQLSTPHPDVWPDEKNVDDVDPEAEAGPDRRHRKSRFQALELAVHDRRSLMHGADGGSHVEKKDEPDPLGTSNSVVESLLNRGVLLPSDALKRNQYLLSSTAFSPKHFLSDMHADADTPTLLQGLDMLSKSIDQKSASLKVLVETHFERFVRAKATIDNVYKEMKYRGIDPTQYRNGRHSRNSNRSSFRPGSGSGPANPLTLALTGSRQKNALVKESEYGVLGIKVPLLNVSAKAEDVWGPALGGREKEEQLKTVAKHLDRFQEYVELSASVSNHIKRKDYEALVEDYTRARKFADEARRLSSKLDGRSPEDSELYQIVLAARVWNDVDQQMRAFKRNVWKRLMAIQSGPRVESDVNRSQDQYMDLISLLLELGVDDNPIWIWLLTRYEQLKGRVQVSADRVKVEVEVLRRRLANTDRPLPREAALHLRSLGRQTVDGKLPACDSADVIELWEKMASYLTNLVSSNGILGELMDFWQTVQGFIDGKAQRILPLGYNDESRCHHQLSPQAVADLAKGVVEMVDLLRERLFAFFASPPPEDISLLYSPQPCSPTSPASFCSLTPTAFRDPRFNLDPSNIPPPSPKRGEPWEKMAFWPPWSNSISAAHYLSKMMAMVGAGASDMASIEPVASGDGQLLDSLKALVGMSRERCVTALCAAWNNDAENIKYIEDWHRPVESNDVTRMPSLFAAFESALLSGMQTVLYMAEAMEKPSAGNIVLPPPTKLLQMVRSQYVTTLYKALSGMVENAEHFLATDEDDWMSTKEGSQSSNSRSWSMGKGAPNAGDRNVRMLLTLSNLQSLRTRVVPGLNSQFENAFSVKLTDESKTIRDVLGQIDARLFQSYTKPSIDKLREIIQVGLCALDWDPPANQRPQDAKPYIYEVLLMLVLVHTQVSTTVPSLTSQVISFLLEQSSVHILEAARRRPRYSLEALMQATLDIEFIAMTLISFTTKRSSELQTQIYQELDARTDNDARARLQRELPEMRSLLKKLREASKNEFACFKKAKRSGGPSASKFESSVASA